jgi:hypothetical protein
VHRALWALAVAVAMAHLFFPNQALALEPATLLVPSAWRSTGVREEPVVLAARFALREQTRQSQRTFSLLAIKHARLQEGAGMHYSMNLRVQSEGKRHLVIAVVWIKPDGSMELTRWHWV